MAGERQVAIVTGAASGIGRAMTLGLLDAGIDVAAVDRDPVWLGELEEEANDSELIGGLHTILADLTDPSSYDAIVSTVLRARSRVDILVNNAGIGQGSIRADQRRNPIRFWEILPEQWSRFVTVNAPRDHGAALAVACVARCGPSDWAAFSGGALGHFAAPRRNGGEMRRADCLEGDCDNADRTGLTRKSL
jgi:NAD(P)-dependent dehydrogenase (short-subunit alcohol dehydrogenase family)